MLHINADGDIQLTRGDTARLRIDIINDIIDEEYEVTPKDVLRLTVRKTVRDPVRTFQKTIVGSNIFHIEPKDTKRLSFGKYVYDIELTTASGDVYTVVGPRSFEVSKEVTF